MNNHVHLLLMEDAEKDESNLMALSQFFLYLGTRYAQWFNKKYQRSGHLFQNRYRSEAVQDDAYLITVIGYIHQNPVKARLCDRPQDYQWSSRQLLGRKGSLVDEERLSQFVSIADIKAYDTATVEAVMGEGGYGRRPRFSESVAASLICDISAAQTTTQFLALPSDAQRQAVRDLRARHMPIRQIARLTGLSKGMVERWGEG
jgi:hypothetical protein